MALEKREVEIPLNGGMNTSAGAEYQAVETMRDVLDLRINNDGEYEKAASFTSVCTITDTSGGLYASITDTNVDGIVESRGDVFAITRAYGVVAKSGKVVGSGGADISAGIVPYSVTLAPQACRVGKRLTVDRVSATDREQGFQSVASCTYASTTLVVASCVYTTNGSGCTLRLHAVDIATGATVASVMYDNDIVASTAWAVDACENTDATAPGAVITWAMGNGAPFTIRKYRYIASTKSFVYDTALTTDASSVKHRIKTSPTAAGRFILAFNLNTGNVLRAYDIACTAGTIGTAISSHAGVHAAGGGIDIAMSGTSILITSISSTAVGNSIYAERYGTPATAITVDTAGGAEYYLSVACATEVGATAALWATLVDTAVALDANEVEFGLLTFSATTVVETVALGLYTTMPNVQLLSFGHTYDSRAYVLMGMSTSYLAAEPSAMWVRANGYSTTVRGNDPIARVAHDVLATIAGDAYTTNLMSAYAVGSTLYSTLCTDAAVDSMQPATYAAGQTVSLVNCKIGRTPTYAHKDGVATVASGLLFDIDGATAIISQPQVRPYVLLDVSAGTGQTGTFLVVAVVRWVDAAGREHRSAPSVPVSTGAIVNKQIDAYVSVPSFEPYYGTADTRTYSIDIYITPDNNGTYYLANTAGGYKRTAYTDGGTYRLYSALLPGVSSNAQPYSLGDGDDALVSEPPPSFAAIATVGDRMFAVDAEVRSRVWFTKPFEAGIAPEWNTVNTLTIGDDGVGIADVGGIPTVFGEHSIWQIYGEGPNGVGVGSFAPARKLPQEYGCLDPRSVCKTPVGTFFRSRQGVMLLGGDGVSEASAPISGEIAVSGTAESTCSICYDDLASELHVIDGSSYAHWVLNVGEGKWSRMTQTLDGFTPIWNDAITIAGRVYFGSGLDYGSVYRQLATTESQYNRSNNFGWTLETPWIRFDGVTGSLRIRELVIQVRLGETNANRADLTVTYETREGTTESFAWTGAQLSALGSAGDTVNLRCQIASQRTKQFKATLVESVPPGAYDGSSPIAMRVLYSVTPGGDRMRSAGQLKSPT